MSTRIWAAAFALIAMALSACTVTTSSLPIALRPPTETTIRPSSAVFDSMSQETTAPSLREHIFYRGGFVERVPTMYVNFWGFNLSGRDPNGEVFYLTNFLEGIGGSVWLGDVTQYYQTVNGFRQHIQNNAGEMRGAWVDTTSIPQSPSDAQIQAAARRLIAHFGHHKDAIYIVATPHHHNTGGFGQAFCMYHNVVETATGPLAYINLPYQSDAGANCGANAVNPGSSGLLDGVSIIGGAVLVDAQADPFGSGWINPDGAEIGSDCSFLNLRDVTFSTRTFAIQGLWSNKRGVCSDSGP